MKTRNYKLVLTLLLTLCSCSGEGESLSIDSSITSEEISSSIESEESSSRHEHVWGEVTYSWNTDYTLVTATRVCTLDNTHVESEIIGVSKTVKKEATCTELGTYLYTTNEYINPDFEVQTKESPIPLKDHNYSYLSLSDSDHRKTCIDCEHSEVEHHTWDDGTIITYAVIDHGDMIQGDMRLTCTGCEHQIVVKHGITEYHL